jgi:hypothetical protein
MPGSIFNFTVYLHGAAMVYAQPVTGETGSAFADSASNDDHDEDDDSVVNPSLAASQRVGCLRGREMNIMTSGASVLLLAGVTNALWDSFR